MTRLAYQRIRIVTAFGVALIAPLFPAAVFAAGSAQCKPDGTQIEMNACAANELAEADRQLNASYQALLKKEAKNTAFIQKLRKAQRAWIDFRDAELEAMYACTEPNPAVCWGSMLPLRYTSYKAKLTRERNERLRRLMTEGQPADGSN